MKNKNKNENKDKNNNMNKNKIKNKRKNMNKNNLLSRGDANNITGEPGRVFIVIVITVDWSCSNNRQYLNKFARYLTVPRRGTCTNQSRGKLCFIESSTSFLNGCCITK